MDEVPQILNVFFGDMSVVGPRPAAVDQADITRGGDNAVVASVKAGLTSPAALYDYLYGDSIEDEDEYMEKVAPVRLALDRYYIGKQTIGYDVRLIGETIICIFGTIIHRPPMRLLDELESAVSGDVLDVGRNL